MHDEICLDVLCFAALWRFKVFCSFLYSLFKCKKISKKLVNYTKKCLALTLQKWCVMCYSFTDEKTGSLRNDKSGSYNYISIIIPNTGCKDSHTSACFAISAQLESRSTFTVKASWCIHTLLLTMVKVPRKLTFVYIWNMSDTGKYILTTWNDEKFRFCFRAEGGVEEGGGQGWEIWKETYSIGR